VRRRRQNMDKKRNGKASNLGAQQSPIGGAVDPLKAFAEAAAYHAGMSVPAGSSLRGTAGAGTHADLYGPYGTLGKEEGKSEVEEHDGSQMSWNPSDISDDEDEVGALPSADHETSQRSSRWSTVKTKPASLAGRSQIPTVELLLDELEFQVKIRFF